MWSENEIHKSTCWIISILMCKQQKNIKQLQLYEILWPHQSFPKESYHPMDLDQQCTHIRSQCTFSEAQGIPNGVISAWFTEHPRKSKMWICDQKFSNMKPPSTATDGKQLPRKRSSRGSIPIFLQTCQCTIHHSCRWMGPIIEQQEVPHV